MNRVEDLNLKEQMALKRLLALDPTALNPAQRLHLRARRSYLTSSQKFEYSGVLYFPRPALAHEIESVKKFLVKHSIKFIERLVFTLATIWVSKLLKF